MRSHNKAVSYPTFHGLKSTVKFQMKPQFNPRCCLPNAQGPFRLTLLQLPSHFQRCCYDYWPQQNLLKSKVEPLKYSQEASLLKHNLMRHGKVPLKRGEWSQAGLFRQFLFTQSKGMINKLTQNWRLKRFFVLALFQRYSSLSVIWTPLVPGVKFIIIGVVSKIKVGPLRLNNRNKNLHVV